VLDPRILRDDPDRIRDSQRRRGESEEVVDRLADLDARRRAALAAFETLRAEQKSLGRDIGRLQGQKKKADAGKAAALQSDVDEALVRAGRLSEQVKQAEREANELVEDVHTGWQSIANLVDPSAPVGGEEDFRVLEMVGDPRNFDVEGFAPRDHLELGEMLGAIDVPRGVKVSGARFFYLTGPGAQLELALLNLAMSLATGAGFVPMTPPVLVSPQAMEGTGFLGQAAADVYHLDSDDMYLVGTAEVPLAAYHSDEILDSGSLPRRYVGFSPCFRREAGSYGQDTRGIIRVHQFNKVEMFSFTHQEDALAEHDRFVAWEREFFDLLEVPYRVIDVATGDLGASASRKFDIEAWIPTQGSYREVTSTSNCTTFQARRLNVRTRDGSGATTPLATLNGTLVAMPRTIVAILENHQQPDGSVTIPAALRPWMGGREQITPQ